MPDVTPERLPPKTLLPKPVPYCLVKPYAVDQAFLTQMARFIESNPDRFEANAKGSARKNLKFDAAENDIGLPLQELKDDLADYFRLGDYESTPKLKDFIGCITEGGFVHAHTDIDKPGMQHIRINVLLAQPQGCIPVLDGVPLDIRVGAAWLNLASMCEHGTTPVEGPGYRAAMSFGYQINRRRGAQLYERHAMWRERLGLPVEMAEAS